MDQPKFRSKAIRRVTLITADGPITVYEKPRSGRKSSRNMRRLEKAQRRFVEAMQAGNVEYLRLHDKSARKRKDGWARKLGENTAKANKKTMKKLRRIRLF